MATLPPTVRAGRYRVVRRAVLFLFTLLLSVWLLSGLLLFMRQDDLLFHPQPVTAERRAELRARPGVEEIAVTAADGVVLRGWLVAAGPAPRPAVILYGGNGDEISRYAEAAEELGGWSLALVCYRGYGVSAGQPGAAAWLADALAVFDAIAARPDIDRERLVVLGRSLGTGLAAHVAGRRRVAGAVLISPYDSLRNLAGEHFRWLPAGLLLRHRIEAADDARLARAPLLAIIGLEDELVTPARSRALVAAWSGPHALRELPGCDHNRIAAAPETHAALREFLAARTGAGSGHQRPVAPGPGAEAQP